MAIIAVLDSGRYLVGSREVEEIEDDQVELPEGFDLPLDGSYKWLNGAFVPLGHGFSKPSAAPVSMEAVVAALARALQRSEITVSAEIDDWLAWYDRNLKTRNDEQQRVRRIRSGG